MTNADMHNKLSASLGDHAYETPLLYRLNFKTQKSKSQGKYGLFTYERLINRAGPNIRPVSDNIFLKSSSEKFPDFTLSSFLPARL